MDTNEIWNYLQNHNYFLNHRLYNKFQVITPSYVEINDIKNKVMLEIGNGFGRNTAWFSQHAQQVIGVEINKKIIEEAKNFITKNGDIKKVKLYLSSDYITKLPQLDYVFCRFVFQHINKDLCKNYIDVINQKLKMHGKINLQFRIGDQIKIENNIEPIIEYTLEEIDNLLENFEINKMYFHENNHVYILGTKLL